MSGEISLADKVHYSELLCKSDLLPKQFRDKPANVLLAIEFGYSLGLEPIQAIQNIHVIEGRPSLSATALSALVRRAGHKLRVTGDDTTATATIVRHDDPTHPFTATWTIAMAKHAGLVGKDNWKNYPAAMLRARATAQCARDACAELVLGIPMPDESADTWPTPETVETIEVDTETGEIIDRAPDELIAKVKAAATAAGYTSHPQVKSLLETVLGRSAGPNLTTPEAEAVLAHLAGAS